MAEPKNRQQFIELEYYISKYADKYFKPIVEKAVNETHSRLSMEAGKHAREDRSPFMDAANPYASIEVKPAETFGDGVVKAVKDRCKKDVRFRSDMEKLVFFYRQTLVAELGAARYNELSGMCDTKDLAKQVVSDRFKEKLIEKISDMKAPKGSLDYIIRKGLGGSLVGWMASPSDGVHELEGKIEEKALKAYGANFAEKASAYSLSLVTDVTTMGGLGGTGTKGVVTTATYVAGDAGLTAVSDVISKKFSSDVILGAAIFGDRKGYRSIRKEAATLDVKKNAEIDIINSAMDNKIYKPHFNNAEAKNYIITMMRNSNSSDGCTVEAYIGKVLDELHVKVNKNITCPRWMELKSDSELHRQACYWTGLALEMHEKNIDHLKVGNHIYTREELAQKGYEYARALKDIQEKRMCETVEIGKAGNVQEQPQQETEESAVSQQTNEQEVQASTEPWSNMLEASGLGMFGGVGRNLGYVLSVLPDMLIGMFTGKTTNLKLQDNLLPLSLIMMGMFSKSPILKTMLVGMGGAKLIDNCGKAAVEIRDSQKAKTSTRYLQYTDEPLDSRISNPVMKGDTLVADIDGVPSVITVKGDNALEAYYQGKIPINTFANAVLRKCDEQKNTIEENYENQLEESVVQDRNRGIK